MATNIAISNRKGGVGKTTTAVNLAGAMCEQGKNVLLVDLDPQSNMTMSLGFSGREETSVVNAICGESELTQVIKEGPVNGMSIAPGSEDLARGEAFLSEEMKTGVIKEMISGLNGRLDYVIFDCPPSINMLTVNALVASEWLLIPVQAQFLPLVGLKQLLSIVGVIQERIHRDADSLKICGVLMTFFEKTTTISRESVAYARDHLGELVFETMIKKTVKIAESPAAGLPVTSFAPKCEGAEQYRLLAKEMEGRIKGIG